MRRGEVRWYKFEKPEKKRPVLILTRDSVLQYLNEVTVIPLTTKIRNIPSEVIVDKEDGLPRRCAVNCDHIQTVSKGRIGNLVTVISESGMKRVSYAVGFVLSLW